MFADPGVSIWPNNTKRKELIDCFETDKIRLVVRTNTGKLFDEIGF